MVRGEKPTGAGKMSVLGLKAPIPRSEPPSQQKRSKESAVDGSPCLRGLLSNNPCAKTLICRISSEKRRRTLPSIYQHLKLFLSFSELKLFYYILDLESAAPLQMAQVLPRVLSHCSKKERKTNASEAIRTKEWRPGALPSPAGVQTPCPSSSEPRQGCSSLSLSAQPWEQHPDGTLGRRSWAAGAEPACDTCWMLMEGEEDNGSGCDAPAEGKWGPDTWPQETLKGKQRGLLGA